MELDPNDPLTWREDAASLMHRYIDNCADTQTGMESQLSMDTQSLKSMDSQLGMDTESVTSNDASSTDSQLGMDSQSLKSLDSQLGMDTESGNSFKVGSKRKFDDFIGKEVNTTNASKKFKKKHEPLYVRLIGQTIQVKIYNNT